MLSTENNTSKLYSEYKITAGEVTFDEGNTSEWAYVDTYFVTCSSDDDCIDCNGCTIDIYNEGLCSNIPVDDCIDCRLVTINVVLDAHPDNTTWALYLHGTNIEIISGDPYPLQLVSNGRKKKVDISVLYFFMCNE